MAAAFGPTMGHNESSPTLQPLTHAPRQERVSPASSRRHAPIAIPDFVFPAQAAPAPTEFDEQQSPVPLNQQEFRFPARDNGPAPRPNALPDFCFNPGASLPPDRNSPSFLSPPTSPLSPKQVPSPSRPVRHGHRRGGSEFVGGSIRDGSSIAVMSTSPTKESGFPTQLLQPPPPRRGHRRGMSGAISTNDLPILQPPTVDWTPKGSSAPNSPTNFDQGINATIPLVDDALNITPLPEPVQDVPTPPQGSEESDNFVAPSPRPAKSTARARVGFSDTLEFIPRPLSMVSSDTSSTVTARPGHSMSESISSVVSPTGFSDDYSMIPLSRSPTKEMQDSRPSTAGAILETIASPDPDQTNTSPRRRNSNPTLTGVEATIADAVLPSSTRPKRWSFFGLEPFGPSNASPKGRPVSSSSSDSASRVHAGSSSDRGSDSEAADPSRSKQKKKNRRSKTKAVKGWAGSILPIKSKGEKHRPKTGLVRPPTPPPSITPMDEDEDDEDDDAEKQLMNPPSVHIQPPQPTLVTEQPRRPEEIMSPMIDLDAALGPFNTPLPHNPEWEAAQRAAGNNGRRRLHSAQGMKGFGGPGMHYHRRAESAPDLPPFEAGRGIHRFGSNSTMADVFEEEEDEDNKKEDDSSGGNEMHSSETSMKSESKMEHIIISDSCSETTSLRGLAVRRKSSGLSDKDQTGARSVRAECSRTSLHESVIAEEPTSSGSTLQSPVMPSSHRNSWDSGAPSPKRILPASTNEPPPVDAVPLTLPQGAFMPLSPYSISTTSSYPSPRSPMSDAHRVSTAPSSVAEDNSFQSLLMGEPGPEVRISMDYDIPSLTSSTSTMTRESGFNPQARPHPSALRDQRPSSVSSAAFGRRRSSLISLSRLISSSHGERSKLSTELTFEEAENRTARKNKSKSKKLGRMMQFWKPNKDSSST